MLFFGIVTDVGDGGDVTAAKTDRDQQRNKLKHTWRGIPNHYANTGGFVSSIFSQIDFSRSGTTPAAYIRVKAQEKGFGVWENVLFKNIATRRILAQ